MSSAARSDSNQATWPLIALAIGAFGIGTTEFGPMGMLPAIADGIDVSIPTAGMLVSAYAIGVMIGAPIMTLLLARRPRRQALIMLMAIFTLGNLLSAFAPDFTSLVGARFITSLNHGAFFGLGSMVAASLVPREKQASAVAAMFLGLTIANIGGVPAAAWLGTAIGWRESFASISVLGVVAMLALRFALPEGEAGQVPDVRAELRVLTRPNVLMAMMTTVLGAGAMFTLYTYINPTLETLTHASPSFITGMLVLVGIGFTIGNTLGGRLADRSLQGALALFLSMIAVSMLAFPFLAASHIGVAVALVVWGIATFAIVPPLQTWVMREATGAPGLASSVNVGAFNLGNAVGAALGGLVLRYDLGYQVVPVAGAGLAVLSVLLVLAQFRSVRRQAAIAAQTC